MCAQHWVPAAFHTGAICKSYNPYTPLCQNRLGKVQPSHLYNKGPTLPMAAILTMADYQCFRNPIGKKLVKYEQQKIIEIKQVR